MWRTLDHTADVGLEIEAGSWPGLLEESARAFGEWTSGARLPAEPHETLRPVAVQGADRVETWVGFWRALLRLVTVEGFLPLHARVTAAPDGRGVRAEIGCLSLGALDPGHCQDVKAVTWHAATVTEEGGRWRGTIVLDL